MEDVAAEPAEVFVGRRAELRLLHAELRSVRCGQPRLVWGEGEAGVAMSALLRRFLTGQGAPVLRLVPGGAEEGEGSLTYGLLGQICPSASDPTAADLRLLVHRPARDTDPLAARGWTNREIGPRCT